jgi:hypothetical protein
MPANVNLHVTELTMESDMPVERCRLAGLFEAEMRRLFIEGGIPAAFYDSGNRDRLAAASRDLRHLPAADAAHELAGAVYVGLGGRRAHLGHLAGSTGRGGT